MAPAVGVSDRRRAVRHIPGGAWAIRLVFIAVLLMLWHLAAATPALRLTLPSPGATAGAIGRLIQQQALWVDVALTLRSALLGLAIATVGGVLLGLAIGASRFLEASTAFTIDFMRTIPGLAVIPLGILVFGPTVRLDIFMIVFSAIWAVIIQSIAAVRNLDPAVKEFASVYRVATWRKYLQVLLPACLPAIVAGIRVAAVLSLLLSVGTQLLTGSPGLGSRIALYQETSNYSAMYGCVVLTAILGMAFNAGVRLAERRALRWYFLPREMARG